MESNKIVFRFIRISLSILIALLIIFGLYKAANYAYEFGYQVFTEEAVDSEPGKDKLVQITENMSDSDIAKLLQDKGLIRDDRLFLAQLKLTAFKDNLNPGTYTLNTSMTARDMIVIMASAEESTEEASETSSDSEQSTESETEVPLEGSTEE